MQPSRIPVPTSRLQGGSSAGHSSRPPSCGSGGALSIGGKTACSAARSTRPPASQGAVVKGMANSHQHTDAYMQHMYEALEEMGVDTSDDPYKYVVTFLKRGPCGWSGSTLYLHKSSVAHAGFCVV
eukprot:1684956-Pleurochrysis_carterae.AAC.1